MIAIPRSSMAPRRNSLSRTSALLALPLFLGSFGDAEAQVNLNQDRLDTTVLDRRSFNEAATNRIFELFKEHGGAGATITFQGRQVRIEDRFESSAAMIDRFISEGILSRDVLGQSGWGLADALIVQDPGIYQQAGEPRATARTIQARFDTEIAGCPDEACRIQVRQAYPYLEEVVSTLSSFPTQCSVAARQYNLRVRSISQNGDSITARQNLNQAGQQLDLQCMAAPWDSPATGSGRPPAGALEATALLEVAGEASPFCGGVFANNREVVTALHCFARPEYYAALRDGKIRVRQAANPRDSWSADAVAMPPDTLVGRRDIPFADDSMRLRLSSGPVTVPQVSFAAPTRLSSAFVAGYFRHRNEGRRAPGTDGEWLASPEAWRGLRWSKPGICYAVDAAPGCFRMICQTVQGFSGSPVFATEERPANAPLQAFGLVSGTEGNVVCRPDPLALNTVGTTPQ